MECVDLRGGRRKQRLDGGPSLPLYACCPPTIPAIVSDKCRSEGRRGDAAALLMRPNFAEEEDNDDDDEEKEETPVVSEPRGRFLDLLAAEDDDDDEEEEDETASLHVCARC